MSDDAIKILVTNDDGVRAPALRALADAAREIGEVTVVAPDREQSGASHAMTLRTPLRVQKVEERWYAVEGTPTDCVNLAFFHLMESAPDLVLSGINAGYNLGDDVTYSGTVAGAMEGRILGAASLSVSQPFGAGLEESASVARLACTLARRLLDNPLPEGAFLNVNVPSGAEHFRITRQGRRVYREGLITRQDPMGREYYWIGMAPEEWYRDPRADHDAVEQGFISVSPLHADLTFHRVLPMLETWDLPGRRGS